MRKYLILAITAIAAVAMTSIAKADDIQSITAKLTPSKLDKKKYKPAKIYVEILTGANTGDATFPEQPPSAYNTKVNFPSNMKFDTTKAPKCKVSDDQLNGTTTQGAIDACGKKSIVSKGGGVPDSPEHSSGTSAWVTVQVVPGPGGATFGVPVQVTAFNGKKKNTLYLHSRADSVNNTSVLVGKIKKARRATASSSTSRSPISTPARSPASRRP